MINREQFRQCLPIVRKRGQSIVQGYCTDGVRSCGVGHIALRTQLMSDLSQTPRPNLIIIHYKAIHSILQGTYNYRPFHPSLKLHFPRISSYLSAKMYTQSETESWLKGVNLQIKWHQIQTANENSSSRPSMASILHECQLSLLKMPLEKLPTSPNSMAWKPSRRQESVIPFQSTSLTINSTQQECSLSSKAKATKSSELVRHL
jgi:hypothetical protein